MKIEILSVRLGAGCYYIDANVTKDGRNYFVTATHDYASLYDNWRDEDLHDAAAEEAAGIIEYNFGRMEGGKLRPGETFGEI